jgi:hypothetical protein
MKPYDDQPSVTEIHVPEWDDGSHHPNAVYEGRHPHVAPSEPDEPVGTLVTPGPRLGGYTHILGGVSVSDFREHVAAAIVDRGGITRLSDHEVLLSVLHPDGAWRRHGSDKPRWVQCTAHEMTDAGVAQDVERFLSEYWECPPASDFFGATDPEEIRVKKELGYWTRTPPGELPGLGLPNPQMLYTDDGRSISNISSGGGQVGAIGQATAASSTTLTTQSTYTTNQWTGYRVYVTTSATNMVWGNVISNTNAAGAGVLTVDRWYQASSPGGSAGSTPASFTNFGTFMIADGGMVSAWFVGLATGANAPAHGDHTLATNGNAEITTSGGGLIRKIAPYAQTSGVATRAFTLTPVYTANGTDSLPAAVTTAGRFASMVSTFGGAGGPMPFETALSASATLSSSGDQLTLTSTENGS